MENILFFSQPHLESGLILWHQKYACYFQENAWMLKQRFWAEMVRRSGSVAREDVEQALQVQHDSFTAGLQVHLGEILLRRHLLGIERLSRLLQKMGIWILFCPACRLMIYKEAFLPAQEHLCPRCESKMSLAVEKSGFPVEALRVDLFSPRLLGNQEILQQENFLFLEVSEYLDKDLPILEQEIALLFNSCHSWLSGLSEDTSSQGTRDMAITDAISRKLLSLNLPPNVDPGLPGSFIPVFWGYMHHLQELLWTLRQKVFAQICLDHLYLGMSQLQQGMEVQSRALRAGKLVHLGQILLQVYLLSDEQACRILREMGEKIYSCPSCRIFLLQAMAEGMPGCPGCDRMCAEESFSPELLRQSLFSGLQPVVSVTGSLPREFVFYRERPGYTPHFSTAWEETCAAFESLARADRSVEGQDLPVEHGGAEAQDVVAAAGAVDAGFKSTRSSQEIHQFMESIGNISTEEGIYDRYSPAEIEAKPPPPAEPRREGSPRQYFTTGMARNAVPTAIEVVVPRSRPPISTATKIFMAGAVGMALIAIALLFQSLHSSSTEVTRSNQRDKTSRESPGETPEPVPEPDKPVYTGHTDDPPPPQYGSHTSDMGKLAGKVNLNGQVVHGLEVIATPADETAGVVTAFCADDGSFIADAKPGEYRLYLAQGNYRWESHQTVYVYAGKESAVDLELPILGSIKGIATMPPGKGAASSAVLTFFNTDTQQTVRRETQISANGEFIVTNIDRGNYRVTLSIPGLPVLPSQNVDVSPGVQSLLEFQWNMGTVEGYVDPVSPVLKPRVVLHELFPGKDGRIQLASMPAKTTHPDEGGRFAFPDVKPGSYLVTAKSESAEKSAEVSVAPYDMVFVQLRLEEYHNMTVRVRHKKRPVSGAVVVASSKPYGEVVGKAVTDGKGEARLTRLPPGEYAIAVECEGTEGKLRHDTSITILPADRSTSILMEIK